MRFVIKALLVSSFFLVNQAFCQILDHPPKIVSSINPIYQIAQFISGDKKNNSLLINPKIFEYSYYFSPSDINIIRNADILFYVSDDLESSVPIALSSLKTPPKIVQLIESKNIKLLSLQLRFNEYKNDPHIWLDPDNGISIATNIAQSLSILYPSGAQTYQKNLEQFINDVGEMDKKNKINLLKSPLNSFIIGYNNTAYLENYYNIKSDGVMHYNYGQYLTTGDVYRIDNLIKTNKITCIFGSVRDTSGSTKQITANNNIKFISINVVGNKLDDNQNGYTKIITDLIGKISQCTKSQ